MSPDRSVVKVELPGAAPRSYAVVIGTGILGREVRRLARELAPGGWLVIADAAVAGSWADTVAEGLREGPAPVTLREVPSGEATKSRETVARLQDEAIAAGLGRDGVVVAVGGGVVGDLAGFVAATLFRGVDYVQVPTTLLAMVDSSVGGKTGIDTPAGKNLVGAFHQPARVVADVDTLGSLPDRELSSALAEVIKYGVILDEQLFIDLEDGLLESCRARVPEALARVIAQCVRLKAEVVADDEKESGRRRILNFGHTVGHAVEAAAGYALRHGEAVAAGMVVEARLAARLVGAPGELAVRIAGLCDRAGLPTAAPGDLDPERLVELAGRDKKVAAGRIRCALPRQVGRMAGEETGWAVTVEEDVFREALATDPGRD